MKKRLITFLAVTFSVIMAFSALGGCRLVTKNNERDFDQVVATVNVTEKEDVYKRDLIMGYLNYGYMYAQYYGWTAARTYNFILDTLIENRIMVQYAYSEFEENDDIVDETKAKYTAERYLDEDAVTDAKYDTYKSINDLLKNYTDDGTGDYKADSVIGDVRTIPTNAKNAEKELTKAEKDEYVAKGFDIDSDEYVRKAFNKVVNLLRSNNLLGSDFNGRIEDTDYFAKLLKSNLESQVIEKFEEKVLSEIRSQISYEKLAELYDSKLEEQQGWDNAVFAEKLSSASASNPVLVSAFGTYGYVYNLLIGVNDYQSAEISELKEEVVHEVWDEATYSEKRAEILADVIAKDLRTSWILSGYDFDGTRFTGDYAIATDSLEFKGVTELVRAADEENDLSAVYAVKSVNTYGLDDFIALVNDYVYGGAEGEKTENDYDIYYDHSGSGAQKPAEYDEKINELLFAFSTDSGSLNTYKGYVIKPPVDGTASEQYVKTFGDAGRALLSEGGYGYKVVASDYGYHFMFFSEVFTADYGFESLEDYLEYLGIERGNDSWDEYLAARMGDWEQFEKDNDYLYILANEFISDKLSAETTETKNNIVNLYRWGAQKDKVTVYESRYSDLLG